jgi:hypothetical protein
MLGDPNPNLIQTLQSERFVLQVQQSATSSSTQQMTDTVDPHRNIPSTGMDGSKGGSKGDSLRDRANPLSSTSQSKRRNKTQRNSRQGVQPLTLKVLDTPMMWQVLLLKE